MIPKKPEKMYRMVKLFDGGEQLSLESRSRNQAIDEAQKREDAIVEELHRIRNRFLLNDKVEQELYWLIQQIEGK